MNGPDWCGPGCACEGTCDYYGGKCVTCGHLPDASYEVRMWGLNQAHRDALLALSRAWDTFYQEGTTGEAIPGRPRRSGADA